MPDPGFVWRNQTTEKLEINMQFLMKRRAQELSSKTRGDILGSIIATTFLLVMIVWRFAWMSGPLQQTVIALIAIWMLMSLYRFRDRLWRRVPPEPAEMAAPALEYYRKELQRRRDHIRSIWIWYGPILLACLFFVATAVTEAGPSRETLAKIAPFVIMLLTWMMMSFHLRRRHAKQIDDEIRELAD